MAWWPDAHALPTPGLVALFVAAAAVVWVAGHHLAKRADGIARRTGMSDAFAGMLLLAVATSLPEVAAVATAGAMGDASLAVNNLMGGIAFQTVLLAAADVAMGRRGVTASAANARPMLQGTLLMILLATVVMAVTVGDRPVVFGVGAWSLVVGAGYLLALWVVHRVKPPWRPERGAREESAPEPSRDTLRRHATRFAAAALFTLGAGVLVTQAAEELARRTGLGSGLTGLLLVALATSLPELSSTIGAARLGAAGLALGGIFGTNLADVAVLLVADGFYREGAVLAEGGAFEAAAAALGIILTGIYVVGLVRRDERKWLRMGWDSHAVLVVYALGVALLVGLR